MKSHTKLIVNTSILVWTFLSRSYTHLCFIIYTGQWSHCLHTLPQCGGNNVSKNADFRTKNAVFRPKIHFFSDIVQTFCYHHDWTPKRQHFCVDPVARRASGRPPGPIFGPKICVFLRYAYITPIFSAPTDPTQWDHKSPTSWGNSG